MAGAVTDHDDDAQGQAERRDAGRVGTPASEDATPDGGRETLDRRAPPPAGTHAAAGPDTPTGRFTSSHPAPPQPTGAATRLAEEMRREAELRAMRSAPPAGDPAGEPRPTSGREGNPTRPTAATRAFLERLSEATGELVALVDRVRRSTDELLAELAAATDAPRASEPAARREPPAATRAEPEPPEDLTPPPVNGHGGGPARSPGPEAAQPGEEEQRARLLAFNMALNGAAREETARYLTENVPLVDKTDLLNEIYRRASPGATAQPPSRVIKEL